MRLGFPSTRSFDRTVMYPAVEFDARSKEWENFRWNDRGELRVPRVMAVENRERKYILESRYQLICIYFFLYQKRDLLNANLPKFTKNRWKILKRVGVESILIIMEQLRTVIILLNLNRINENYWIQFLNFSRFFKLHQLNFLFI